MLYSPGSQDARARQDPCLMGRCQQLLQLLLPAHTQIHAQDRPAVLFLHCNVMHAWKAV